MAMENALNVTEKEIGDVTHVVVPVIAENVGELAKYAVLHAMAGDEYNTATLMVITTGKIVRNVEEVVVLHVQTVDLVCRRQ